MTQGQQRILLASVDAAQLPRPAFEVQFAKPRKWRADALWAFERVALECEGGYAMQGRHTRVGGFLKDMEKYNTLACLGYRLIRVAPKHITNGVAIQWIQKALKGL